MVRLLEGLKTGVGNKGRQYRWQRENMTGLVTDEDVRLRANYYTMHCIMGANTVTSSSAITHIARWLATWPNILLINFIYHWVGAWMLAFSGSPLDAVSICLVLYVDISKAAVGQAEMFVVVMCISKCNQWNKANFDMIFFLKNYSYVLKIRKS